MIRNDNNENDRKCLQTVESPPQTIGLKDQDSDAGKTMMTHNATQLGTQHLDEMSSGIGRKVK
jgi:hypothetical protein